MSEETIISLKATADFKTAVRELGKLKKIIDSVGDSYKGMAIDARKIQTAQDILTIQDEKTSASAKRAAAARLNASGAIHEFADAIKKTVLTTESAFKKELKALKEAEKSNEKYIDSISKRWQAEATGNKYSRQTFDELTSLISKKEKVLLSSQKALESYKKATGGIRSEIEKLTTEEVASEKALTLAREKTIVQKAMLRHLTSADIETRKKHGKVLAQNFREEKKLSRELEIRKEATTAAKNALDLYIDANRKDYLTLRLKHTQMAKEVDGYKVIRNAVDQRLSQLHGEIHSNERYNETIKKQTKLLKNLSLMEKSFERRGQFNEADKARRMIADISRTENTNRESLYTFKQGGVLGLPFDSTDEMEKHIKNVDKIDKQFKKLNKSLKSGTGFLNSWFGKFSIVMSGTAATIFVLQNVFRAIGAFAAPLLEIEKALIEMKMALAGNTEEWSAYQAAAEEAARAGYKSTGENIKLLTDLREKGYSAAEAMAILKHEAMLYEEAAGGTITADLDKLVANLKELATEVFLLIKDELSAIVNTIIRALKALNQFLENARERRANNRGFIEMGAPEADPNNKTGNWFVNFMRSMSAENDADRQQWLKDRTEKYLKEIAENTGKAVSEAASGPSVMQSLDAAAEAMNKIDGIVSREITQAEKDRQMYLASFQRFQKIEKVIDGDTLKIKDPMGHPMNVRIKGVDTPESVNHPDRKTDFMGEEVTNVTEGLLAKYFTSMVVSQSGGVTLKNVGEDAKGRLAADAYLSSGFNIADVLTSMGIGKEMDYAKRTREEMIAPKDIQITGTEYAGEATKSLLNNLEKLKKYADEHGINLELIKEQDLENWDKADPIMKEMAKAFYDMASLSGKLGIDEFYRAQQKMAQEAADRLEKNKMVLAETGAMTDDYVDGMQTQIATEQRLLEEAGVEEAYRDKIEAVRQFELGLEKELAMMSGLSQKEVEYAEKAAEESLAVNMSLLTRKEALAQNEADRLRKYANDNVAAEIVIAKDRISRLQALSAKDRYAFGYTDKMKDDTIQLLRDTAYEEARIVFMKTGDIKAAQIAYSKKSIELSEEVARFEKERFEKTGVASAEFFTQQAALIDEWAEYYAQKTGDVYAGEKYAMEEGLNLFKNMYAERLKSYEAFNAETGSMTLDHYAYLRTIVEAEAKNMQESLENQGYKPVDAKNIAEATKQMKMFNLEVKNLRNSSDVIGAMGMGLKNVTEATRSAAEAAYDFGLAVNQSFDAGIKDAFADFLKTDTFDFKATMASILEPIVDAWADMAIEMTTTWLMKDKTILVAEKATAAEIVAVNQTSAATIVATQKATTDAIIALKLYEANIIKMATLEAEEAKQFGYITQAAVAESAAVAQVGIAMSVADAQIAASNMATETVVSNYAAQVAAAQAAAASTNAATSSTGWGMAVVAIGVIASQAFKMFGGDSGPSREDILKQLAKELAEYTKRMEASNKRFERIMMEDTISQWLENIYDIGEQMNDNLEAIKDSIIKQAKAIYTEQKYEDYLANWTPPEPVEPEAPSGPPERPDFGGLSVMDISTAVEDGVASALEDGGYDIDFGSPNDGLSGPPAGDDPYGGGPDFDLPAPEPMTYKQWLDANEQIKQIFKDMEDMGPYALRDALEALDKDLGGSGAMKKLIQSIEETIREFENSLLDMADQIKDSTDEFASQWLDNSTQYETDVKEAKDRYMDALTGFGEIIETYLDQLSPDKLEEWGIDKDDFEDLVKNSGTLEGAKALYDTITRLAAVSNDEILWGFSATISSMMEQWEAVNVAINQKAFDDRAEIWTKDIGRYFDTLTGAASDLDKELWSVNDQFDSWKETLTDLGATTEELARLEALRNAALELTALNYQKDLLESGTNSLGGLIDRLKGMIEDQLTKDFTIEDWTNIIYKAGEKLDLLDKSTYEDEAQYWEDVVDLSTLQLDALQNIIELTQQEISAIESSRDGIQNLLDRLQGGDLDPVQSVDFFNDKYTTLLNAATSPDATSADIDAFVAFVPEFLDFMKQFGYDYQAMVDVVTADLNQVDTVAGATLDDLNGQLLSIVSGLGGLDESMEDIIGARLDLLIEYTGIAYGETGPMHYVASLLIARYEDAQRQTQEIIDAIKDADYGSYYPDPNEDPPEVPVLIPPPDDIEDSIPFDPVPLLPETPDWLPDDGIGLVKEPIVRDPVPDADDSIIIKTVVGDDSAETAVTPSLKDIIEERMELIGGGLAKGGITSGLTLAGEKGAEWVVPTYNPERDSFLSSINLSPETLAGEIARYLPQPQSTNSEEFTANFEIMIGSEKFGAAMVKSMKKDPEVRKAIKAMVR